MVMKTRKSNQMLIHKVYNMFLFWGTHRESDDQNVLPGL